MHLSFYTRREPVHLISSHLISSLFESICWQWYGTGSSTLRKHETNYSAWHISFYLDWIFAIRSPFIISWPSCNQYTEYICSLFTLNDSQFAISNIRFVGMRCGTLLIVNRVLNFCIKSIRCGASNVEKLQTIDKSEHRQK